MSRAGSAAKHSALRVTAYIERGSPWENGYAESFHSRLRNEFLATEEFESLTAARRLSTLWQDDYNLNRPHSSLEYQTPAEFAARCAASAPATPALQQHSELTCPDLHNDWIRNSIQASMPPSRPWHWNLPATTSASTDPISSFPNP